MSLWLWLLSCRSAPELLDPAVALMASLDQDGSGMIELAELSQPDPSPILKSIDQDGDQAISLAELRHHMDTWPPNQQMPQRAPKRPGERKSHPDRP